MMLSALTPFVVSTLAALRELRLAWLHGDGLRRPGATRGQLIGTEADQYPALAAWGRPSTTARPSRTGSRGARATTTTPSRSCCSPTASSARDLEVVVPPVPLVAGRGRERLFELAERAGITLVD